MGSHSLLFTFDTYTQTGAMFSFQMTQRLMLQGSHYSRYRHGPLVCGCHSDRFLRLPLGVRG